MGRRGQDYLEIEALWGRSACSLIRAHRASQLTKKPCVSEDLIAVLIGTSFSRERCLVREQGEAGSEQTVGKGKDLGRDGARGERKREIEVGLSESDVFANATGAGVSSGVHCLVLLENRRLNHFMPAENVVSVVEWCGLVPPKY